jgi:hypothetical protein
MRIQLVKCVVRICDTYEWIRSLPHLQASLHVAQTRRGEWRHCIARSGVAETWHKVSTTSEFRQPKPRGNARGAGSPATKMKTWAAVTGIITLTTVSNSSKPVLVRMRRLTRPHGGAGNHHTARYVLHSCTTQIGHIRERGVPCGRRDARAFLENSKDVNQSYGGSAPL